MIMRVSKQKRNKSGMEERTQFDHELLSLPSSVVRVRIRSAKCYS